MSRRDGTLNAKWQKAQDETLVHEFLNLSKRDSYEGFGYRPQWQNRHEQMRRIRRGGNR